MSLVALAGSRVLPPALAPVVPLVVGALLACGCSVAVGCCVGADLAVVSAALSALRLRRLSASRLRVFAAFGSSGAGALASSAVAAVGAAAEAGCPVSWWAGGSSRVPPRARLARRSAAVVSASSALVLFVGVSSSAGSFLAARRAVSAGLPVLVFSSFGRPPLLPSVVGRWLPCPCLLGVAPGVSAWRWSSAARLLPVEAWPEDVSSW